MQSKVKLTKRQMKEDKFTTFMLTSKDKLQSELEDKWQYYLIGAIVVVVLIWAAVWFFGRQSSQESGAAAAYSKAMMSYMNRDNQVAALEFQQVIQEYGGTDFAANAAFILGNINLENRSYDEAVRYYRMYLDEFAGTPLNRAAATAGIATAAENQGKYSEAAALFVEAAQANAEGALRPDYEVGAIRNFLADGKIDQAETRLAILKDKYAGTAWTARAIRLITEKKQAG
jgi:TolA-binding protein